MAGSGRGLYGQIAANRRRSILICVVFFAIVAALGWFLGWILGGTQYAVHYGLMGLVVAAVVALAMIWSSYYYSDTIVLKMSRAQPIQPNLYPKHKFLDNEVEGLAIAAGMPKPRIFIIDDSAPNAFATGRNPKRAVVAVTSGLLDKLDRYELQGVLAHEMSHIKNYDILLQTIVVVMVGVVALLSDWILRAAWSGSLGRGRSRRSRSGAGRGGAGALLILVIGLVMAILAPIIAQLLRFAVSRKREFLADADGALLTRYPEGLAKALEKLSADREPLEVANKATAHMYIVNPLKTAGRSHGLDGLFSTHPPVEERIQALRSM